MLPPEGDIGYNGYYSVNWTLEYINRGCTLIQAWKVQFGILIHAREPSGNTVRTPSKKWNVFLLAQTYVLF